MPRAARGAERGSGTVLALGLVAVLAVLALAVAGLAAAVHARGTAQTAADLGALAAATALQHPLGPDPCGVARQVVAANGADLARCRVSWEEVTVEAHVPMAAPWPAARAHARAGPAR